MARNTGISEISSLDEAKDAWESFFGRFFSPEVPEGVDVSFNAELRKFTPRENPDAKYQAPFKDEGRTYHSDDFDDFLNGNTVTIPDRMSLTQKNLDIVEKAISEGNYEHSCFSNRPHLFYALWLFKQNKITRQQLTTILARAQVILAGTPIKKTFSILDNDGQFTQDAKDILLPLLKKHAYGGDLTGWHLERFRLLMQAAPKSEQMFYISKANRAIVTGWGEQLGDALARNKAWYIKKSLIGEDEDIHLSFGAIEGLQIAIRGISGTAARAKLGKVSLDTVKEGVEYYYRPTAISIAESGVEATTKGIHEYPYSPMPAVTAHDTFHERLNDTIPPEFHMMLNHMYYIAKEHTKLPWTKLLWELADREFHRFQYQSINIDTPQEGAKLFVKMFSSNNIKYAHPLLINNTLSAEGIAILWDMVNQPKLWQKIYKVDIDSLGEPYKKHIIKMKAFAEKMNKDKDEHPKLISLKYRLFCTTSPEDYERLTQIIDAVKEDLLNSKAKLHFGKTKLLNIVVLKFGIPKGKTEFITETSVKKFIPTLADKYLFRGVNNQLIQQEVVALSGKWGSIHEEGHQISAKDLDELLQKFSSFAEKLKFLERCGQVVKSKEYKRRHETADNIFAFLKNPLTTSQRQHVRLLQEKMQELVKERLGELQDNQEELDEFKWLMENRNSKLAQLNTKRFYLHFDTPSPTKKPT